jgi:hypothetical protein
MFIDIFMTFLLAILLFMYFINNTPTVQITVELLIFITILVCFCVLVWILILKIIDGIIFIITRGINKLFG